MGIVFGVDPGSLFTGYGIVAEEKPSGQDLSCLGFGVIEGGGAKASHGERLFRIGQRLEELFTQFNPKAMVLEKSFFAKNVDSAIKLGQVRGVCLYVAAKANVPIFEYSPTAVKSGIAGSGRAGKEQVQFVIRQLLNLKNEEMEKHDMSDALALAIYHCRSATTLLQMKRREVHP